MTNCRESRPILSLSRSDLENALDIIAVILMVSLVAYLAVMWNALPDVMPIHFTLDGEIDRWGSRYILIVFPVIGIGTWVLIYLVKNSPHKYNYVVKITEENAAVQYRLARVLMRVVMVEILLVFLSVEWLIIRNGMDGGRSLHLVSPLVIATVVIMGITIGIYTYKSFRLK